MKQMKPKDFAFRMNALRELLKGDLEVRHAKMDDFLCETLHTLGYGEGVEIFKDTEMWHA